MFVIICVKALLDRENWNKWKPYRIHITIHFGPYGNPSNVNTAIIQKMITAMNIWLCVCFILSTSISYLKEWSTLGLEVWNTNNQKICFLSTLCMNRNVSKILSKLRTFYTQILRGWKQNVHPRKLILCACRCCCGADVNKSSNIANTHWDHFPLKQNIRPKSRGWGHELGAEKPICTHSPRSLRQRFNHSVQTDLFH